MKKQFILVLAITTLSLASCEEIVEPRSTVPHQAAPAIKITSFYPESARVGTTVAIFGENFGQYLAEHQVRFNNSFAEVAQVQTGMIVVRVPLDLTPGDYTINLSVNGQSGASTKMFKVTEH